MNYPENLTVRCASASHVQGVAIDLQRRYLYFSFTTCLLKTDLQGNLIGSVTGLVGHLGCIAWQDGKIYGSLEYKKDAIGKGILQNLGRETDTEEGFYMAIFDCDAITRPDMDAASVMKAVYLPTVTEDYLSPGHRYGCSGIDGTTFAPLPGCGGKMYLYVAYGIYSDTERRDNDHQILLRYDVSGWEKFATPLDQTKMHRIGPEAPEDRYFVYTGNTRYGIQNLEYDPLSGCAFAAVYRGQKPEFPNYPMYLIDWSKLAEQRPLTGLSREGLCLDLVKTQLCHQLTGICGYDFPYGATGIAALEDGLFYICIPHRTETEFGCRLQLYRHIPGKGFSAVNDH